MYALRGGYFISCPNKAIDVTAKSKVINVFFMDNLVSLQVLRAAVTRSGHEFTEESQSESLVG